MATNDSNGGEEQREKDAKRKQVAAVEGREGGESSSENERGVLPLYAGNDRYK